MLWYKSVFRVLKQESPAIAEPARRESLPKIAPIRRAYNVDADDTGLSWLLLCPKSAKSREIDTIPERDRRTDGWTRCCAYYPR